jgi:hypothetical protein
VNVAATLARRLGLTEGQVYTVATGLVTAVVLLGLGLPQVGDVAAPASAEAPHTAPLALPGSPAVAEVISAAPPPAAEADGEELAAPVLSVSPPALTSGGSDASGAVPGGGGSTPTTAPAPTTTAVPTTAPAPVHVTEARYASASGPLLPSGGPGAYLPVALRVGAPDKQSYLRLAGTGTTLRLALSTQPGHQLGDAIAIRAYHIVPAEWSFEDGAALSGAPEVDQVDCTLGRPGPDGWTFELGTIDTSHGIALVPTGPSTGTFQVTFASGLS